MALSVTPLARSLIAVAMALGTVTLVRADDGASDGEDRPSVTAPAPSRSAPPPVVIDRPADHEDELGGGDRSAHELRDDADDDVVGRHQSDEDGGDLDDTDDDGESD